MRVMDLSFQAMRHSDSKILSIISHFNTHLPLSKPKGVNTYSKTTKMAPRSSPFDLSKCARPNILKLEPYRCARE